MGLSCTKLNLISQRPPIAANQSRKREDRATNEAVDLQKVYFRMWSLRSSLEYRVITGKYSSLYQSLSLVIQQYIYHWLIVMCQFMCCECWWFNCCGVICGGWHKAFCLCSFWVCKPDSLKALDPDCCHVCACDGFGGNYCFTNHH